MATKTKQHVPDVDPTGLRTVKMSGKAPKNRLRNAHQAFQIARDLDDGDCKRQKKRTRIFKQYNRFPPSEYSTLYKTGAAWQSNVPFGMMAFVVDNNLSSFFDMVTERTMAAEIITKFGNERERSEWSEYISMGFDLMLNEWEDYLLNVEQFTLDMLLYGKGIQIWEEKEGFLTEHVSADEILVPNDTKIDLSNWDVIAIKRDYTLVELYKKIQGTESDDETGWNHTSVISAMRMQRTEWKKKKLQDFVNDIADGNITVAGHLKETVPCYILFVREFDDSVSKYIVLRDYAEAKSSTIVRPSGMSEKEWDDKVVDSEDFLYRADNYADDICDVFAVFMDCAGSGRWHRVPSLAEKIFVQCRQYDFVMNGIMDAVKMNMSLMLQPSTADAAKKIKEIVFGPYVFIPSDVPFVQQRVQLPTTEGTQTIQFVMSDMYRGIGEYRVQEKAAGGQAMTATQSQLDAAESAKLSGTQLKRYNSYFTKYFKKLYKKMTECVEGEKDYEICKVFKEFMKERGVPDEAWKYKNIRSIKSNVLTGAGSPSFKLMAAEKTLAITNITPKDEGQRKAQEDAIAALHGRTNVRRYLQPMSPDPTWNERMALWENGVLSDMALNPRSAQVFPNDNHPYHISVHLEDMEMTLQITDQKIQAGDISEAYAEQVAHKLLNQGGHVNAHLQFIQKDPTKQEDYKNAAARLNQIQRMADKLAANLQEMKAAKDEEFDVSKDPEVQKKIAMSQIEVDTKQKLANIKIGGTAASHQQRQQIDQDRAANEIAIQRSKAREELKASRAKNINGSRK